MDARGSLSPFLNGSAGTVCAERREPTLGELLADPLTLKLMAADHVDGEAFARMLHAVAGRLQAGAGAERRLMAFDAGGAAWAPLDRPLRASARFMHGAAGGRDLACGCYC
jgi:hypothetical protein